MLADATDDETAEALYQDWKWHRIARIEGDEWTIARAEILGWRESKAAEQADSRPSDTP